MFPCMHMSWPPPPPPPSVDSWRASLSSDSAAASKCNNQVFTVWWKKPVEQITCFIVLLRMKEPLFPLTWATAHLKQGLLRPQLGGRASTRRRLLENVDPAVESWKRKPTILTTRAWKTKNDFLLLKTEPDSESRLLSDKHQVSCESITGLQREGGCGGTGWVAPTCQVLLQGGRGALVPAVAAEEEEPDQEGGQHQSQDPEEPGHSRVGPGRQEVHAEGCSARCSARCVSSVWRAQWDCSTWTGRTGSVCVLSGGRGGGGGRRATVPTAAGRGSSQSNSNHRWIPAVPEAAQLRPRQLRVCV